jgi:hypothetical protein
MTATGGRTVATMRVVLALVLVWTSGVYRPGGVAVAAAGAGCPSVDGARRNAWHRVPVPESTVELVQTRADACRLLARLADGGLRWSRDGGTSWRALPNVTRATGIAAGVDGLLAVATVALPPASEAGIGTTGLLVSRDGGASFRSAKGTTSVLGQAAVVDAAGQGRVVYVALRALDANAGSVAGAGILRSDDGGATFAPVAGSLGLAPERVVVDPTDPAVVWTVTEQAGRRLLWVSQDSGASFTALTNVADPRDLDVVALPGGASAAVIATDGGMAVTTDRGVNVFPTASGAFSSVRVEPTAPNVLLVTRSGQVASSTDGGVRFTAADAGLPAGCTRSVEMRDAGRPAVFLASCGAAWFRRQSTGAGFGDAAAGRAGGPKPDPTGATNTLLVPEQIGELHRWPLPHLDGESSTSLAFDGRTLYYGGTVESTDCGRSGFTGETCVGSSVVHRLDARTGTYLGTVPIPVPNVHSFWYDTRRHGLYVSDQQYLYFYGFRDRRLTRLFSTTQFSMRNQFAPSVTWTYDPSIDRFLVARESREMYEVDRAGTVRSVCSLGAATPHGPDALAWTDPTRLRQEREVSALTPAGDGSAYVQMEDDVMLFRVLRGCVATRAWVHRRYVEATAENDSIVCDRQSFPQPVLWLRDASPPSVTAYVVPDAVCQLPTRLAVDAPAESQAGAPAAICVALRTTAAGWAVPAQPVAVFADDVPLGTVTTGGDGRGCLAWSGPLGRHRVEARFLGTPGYTASAARAVTSFAALPRTVVRRDPKTPAAVVGVAGGLPGPVNPPPHVEPNLGAQPGTQAQAQSNPQTNAGTNPQLGVAARERSAAGLALAEQSGEVDELAMSARARDEPSLALLGGAALLASASFVALSRAAPARAVARRSRGRGR